MKKVIGLFFALSIALSLPFVANSISTGNASFSAQAQTVTTTRRKKGIVRRGYAGGRWVAKKVWRGGKWVTIRTWQGTKWVGKKTWKTGRKVVSRTKKIVY